MRSPFPGVLRMLGCTAGVLLLAVPANAQERFRLREVFTPGDQYQVESRVRLNGRLSVPVDPNQPAKLVDMTGESKISYAERLLTPDPKTKGDRSLRLYRQMEFVRKIADRPQELSLRPGVKRVILVRKNQSEVAYSPDGPLTWGELDLIRTDVFTPALVGIGPNQAVAVGESWRVQDSAIQELTDLETLEQGSIDCTLVGITTWNKARTAQLSLKGTVKGVSEDGPTRHLIEGTLYFNLDTNHLAYISITGVQELMDEKGTAVGRIEGRFTLIRTPTQNIVGLENSIVDRLPLEPNAETTRLLVDNTDMGFRLLHPRHWRVGTQRNQQITLDDPVGNGILITVEPLDRMPGALQYQVESKQQLVKFQAKILNETRPVRIDGVGGPLEMFRIDAEMSGQRVTMVYYLIRSGNIGMTIAARIQSKDLAEMLEDIDRIAKSVTLVSPMSR